MASIIRGSDSFHTSARSRRNILINGEVTRINQRDFNGNWGSIGEGVYGYDRWKKSGSNIQQVVEEGNFKPNTVYTLSGNNVTTTQLTSPMSGHWTITVPNNATNVQLEEGLTATPFEKRSFAEELTLCQRYYENLQGSNLHWATAPFVIYQFNPIINFATHKRVIPSLNVVQILGYVNDLQIIGVSRSHFDFRNSSTGHSGISDKYIWWSADAEL